jgi:hypothetical protein
MNINPGGKAPKMRDTTIPGNNPHGRAGGPQSMQFPCNLPPDHPWKSFEGQPKGIAQVLAERGLIQKIGKRWKASNGNTIIGECTQCKADKTRKMPAATDSDDVDDEDDSEAEDDGRQDCCMRRLLMLQEDFKNEKCMIHQVGSSRALYPNLTPFTGNCKCGPHLYIPAQISLRA